jgi:protein kinase-like protein
VLDHTVGSGTVLAGRYRIEDLLTDAVGVRGWRAVDEVLARSVAVQALNSEDPRAGQLLEAARRSSTVTDGRFIRVLDAAEEQGSVYVILEWVAGESLVSALSDGPLPDHRAAWVTRECAAAMAAAHELGIPHLRLVPANVLLTSTGGVKIAGLATEAVLRGVTSKDPEAQDVRDLGRLLYACLVARWPGGAEEGLPCAPTENGRVLRPRQVRAKVPRPLDEVCERIIGRPSRLSAAPLHTAAEVAAALSVFLPTGNGYPGDATGEHPALLSPLAPPQGSPGSSQETATMPAPARAAPAPDAPALGSPAPRLEPPPAPLAPTPGGASAASEPSATGRGESDVAPAQERSWRGRSPWWLALAVLLVGVGIVFYVVGRLGVGADPTTAPRHHPTVAATPTAAPTPERIPIAAVVDYDPVVDGGSGSENPAEAPLAVDGNPHTAWQTLHYDSAKLGNLKPGVGLVLDLGKPTSVSAVKVLLLGRPNNLQLRAAPASAASIPSSATDFRTVAQATSVGGGVILRPAAAVTTRFLLVYLTSLPPDGTGRYMGQIAEISVFG